MIHRQAVKMSGIISQLLSMTRLDQGTELSGMEPVDLAGLLRDFSREQENNQTYDYSRLTLELKEEAVVWGNQVLLTRLIQNLVENAFKYGRPNGHVWAVLDKNGSEVTEFIENFLEICSLGAVFTRHLLVKSPNYERNPVSRLLSFRPRF